MSQVLKYAPGGKFSYNGREYDSNDFLKQVVANKLQFLNESNFSKRERELFEKGYKQIIRGLENGTFRKSNTGEWINDANLNNSGVRDTNIFGGTKRTDNNALGFATGLLDYTLDKVNPIIEETPSKSEYNLDITKDISDAYFGGQDIDANIFALRDEADKNGVRGVSNRLSAIASLLDRRISELNDPEFDVKYSIPSIYKDKQDLLTRMTNLRDSLSDHKFNDDDLIYLNALGLGNLAELIGYKRAKEPDNLLPADKNNLTQTTDNEKLKLQEDFNNKFEELRKYYDNLAWSNRWSFAYNPEDYKNVGAFDIDPDYKPSWEPESQVDNRNYISYILNEFAKQLELGDNMYWIKGDENKYQGNWYYIPDSFNPEDMSMIRIDPESGKIQRASALQTDFGVNMLKGYLERLNYIDKDTNNGKWAEFKNGGVIKKYQSGGFAEYSKKYLNNYKKQKQEQYKTNNTTTTNLTSKKESKNYNKSNESIWKQMDGADYARLGSVVLDLASLGSAYVPGYGTVVSGITGVASSLTNFGADIADDGLDWGDVGSLVLGTGADLVGLVPGLGTSMKVAKIAKVLKPLSKLLSNGFIAYGLVEATEPLNKIVHGQELTKDEYMVLANAIRSVLVGGAGRARKSRNNLTKIDKLLADEYKPITTKDGVKYISPEDYRLVAKQWSLDKQNAKLKELGYDVELTKKQTNLIPFTGLYSASRNYIDKNYFIKRTNPKKNLSNDKLTKYKEKLEQLYNKASIDKKDILSPRNPSSDITVVDNNEILQLYDALNNVLKRNNVSIPYAPTIHKKGGILKALPGAVMTRPNQYLNVENTEENAKNPMLYNGYYNIDKIINDAQSNNWFNNITPEQLNQLNALRKNQGLMSTNKTGYSEFNNAFNTALTELNKNAFGWDESRADYSGPNTYNRMAVINALARKFNSPENSIKTKNGNIYYKNGKFVLDNTNVPMSVIPIERELPLNNTSNPELTLSQTQANGSISGFKGREKLNNVLFLKPEDLIASGRLVGSIITNNRNTKNILSEMKPTLIDTYENYIPQTDNYIAHTSAARNIGAINNEARRISQETSDENIGRLARLSGAAKSADIALQRDLSNEQRMYETGMMSRQESNAAKARRTEVSNRNKLAMNNTALAKEQLKAANKAQNWNSINTFLSGIENNYRQNRLLQLKSEFDLLNQINGMTYLSQFDLLKQLYNSGKITADDFRNKLIELQKEARLNMLKTSRDYTNYNWLLGRKANFSKNGSKLTLQDKKEIQYQKDVAAALRESNKLFFKELQSTRKINSDFIKSLSAFAKQLILQPNENSR